MADTDPLTATAPHVPDPPSAEPAPCPVCESPFFWEDIAGKVHCIHCVKPPAVRMVRDFWTIDGTLLAGGQWAFFRWVHRDPFAQMARWGVKCQVFAHLEREQQLAAEKVAGSDDF